ncbi:hypothetical protein [Gehongia tenuis]|uniref:MrpR N-terminal core-binding domain-containing protein n=1 Tax=Gehongia tenuis TaxID=2763655 RepID=A0A926D3X7_9FIRM|nr:hypothetical protein [Gehongia tenuis]MBC8531940.1 hypothetical protein [Gehongia tenuis]
MNLQDVLRPELSNRSLKEEYVLGGTHDERSAVQLLNRWNRIGNFEREYERDITEFNEENFIDMFTRLNYMTRLGFNAFKWSVTSYLRWLNQQKGWNTEAPLRALQGITFQQLSRDAVYQEKYFGSFSELRDQFRRSLVAQGYEERSRTWDTTRFLVALAWFGVKREEVTEIRKSDVSDDRNEIYLPISKRILVLPAELIARIRLYRDADTVERPGNGGVMTVHYKDSPYLFRTFKSPKVTEVLGLIKNLNRSPGPGKRFSYNRIYWSGIFCRAYAYEQTNGRLQAGDRALAEELFGEHYNHPTAYHARFNEYQNFKRYFYE